MRSWFTESASYSAMGHYRNQTRGLTPPVDLVDRVCAHLAAMLESEALNGYRRRDKAQFTDDVSVVSDRWIAHAIGPFLWEGRMSPAVRERCDVALVLLRHALATGASYMEYDERLYTFEQDIRPELSRRGSGGR